MGFQFSIYLFFSITYNILKVALWNKILKLSFCGISLSSQKYRHKKYNIINSKYKGRLVSKRKRAPLNLRFSTIFQNLEIKSDMGKYSNYLQAKIRNNINKFTAENMS